MPFVLWLFLPLRRSAWRGWLGSHLILVVVVEGLAWWMRRLSENNHMVYLFYALVDFVIIHMVLFRLTRSEPSKNEMKLAVSLLTVSLLFVSLTFIEATHVSMSHFILFSAFTFALHGFVRVYSLSLHTDTPLLQSGGFWIGASFIVAATFDVPSLGLGVHYASSNPELSRNILVVHDVGIVLHYLLCSVGLVVERNNIRGIERRV